MSSTSKPNPSLILDSDGLSLDGLSLDRQASIEAEVPLGAVGDRLDVVAAQLFPDFSRARLQEWIKDQHLLVDGGVGKPKQKLQGGEILTLTPLLEPQGEWLAEDIPLDVVFEDEHILLLNKSDNAVVHPAAGNASGTVLNALLHHDPSLANLPRGGIVHRLDKDTTGLMVVAKTLQAHQSLVAQLQARTVGRHYYAIVNGLVTAKGKVDAPIGRHPVQRKKMAVVKDGKQAITHYQTQKHYQRHTYIRLKLETGRTHQIRVHMQSIAHPLVGDPTYGGRVRADKHLSPELSDVIQGFSRQALHAGGLELIHPHTGDHISWECDLPQDMKDLLTHLDQGLSEEAQSE